ncbi:MAG TPA: pilus assembly protein PilP [Xanthomonadales bacterium]|nr:pilus assembly protein PilP [Xanthomonadales bacterium]
MNHRFNTLSTMSLVALLSMMLVGCMDNKDNLNRYIAEVKARPAAPIPPIPAVRTYTPYVYDGLAGRDPFRRSTSEGSDETVVGTVGDGPRPDLQRTREYLERFELDTLTMVGTFSKESSDWALIRDPDGVVHRVSVGNYMGKNHGKVTIINPDETELSEFIADGAGGWLVRPASMELGGS